MSTSLRQALRLSWCCSETRSGAARLEQALPCLPCPRCACLASRRRGGVALRQIVAAPLPRRLLLHQQQFSKACACSRRRDKHDQRQEALARSSCLLPPPLRSLVLLVAVETLSCARRASPLRLL